ncbi:MAG TPA: hypothetical protein VII09_08690 [Opitutaceae bacterium]
MKNSFLRKGLTAAGLAFVVLAHGASAQAEERIIKREGTYTTSKGGSGTASSTTTRANGVVKRQGTWTNAAGGTGTRQSQTVWNRTNGTATVNGSVTRPNGATATWQGTQERTAPGVFKGSGTITQANGTKDTYTSTDTRVAPGTWDKNEVITTASGKTIDRSVDTSVAGGKGTATVTTTAPDGKTFTQKATFTQSVSSVPAPSNPTN